MFEIATIKITVDNGEGKQLGLSFPEDCNTDDMMDNMCFILRWLTFSDAQIELAMRDYLLEKGWNVADGEDANDD